MHRQVFLTVSEFAKLHGVNKRTLHYYDSAGIFSPQYVGENGYRYYTYLQGTEFEIILALRELGMSVAEIRQYQKNRSSGALSTILAEKTAEVEEKIRQLEQLKTMLTEKNRGLLLAQSPEINHISVVSREEEHLLLVDLTSLSSAVELTDRLLCGLEKHRVEGKSVRLFSTGCGAVAEISKIKEKKYEDYAYLFVRIPGEQRAGLHIRPAGDYLRGFCRGDWKGIPETYARMLSYAEANRLRLGRYAYEEGINGMGIPAEGAMEEYVTEITIPCRKES